MFLIFKRFLKFTLGMEGVSGNWGGRNLIGLVYTGPGYPKYFFNISFRFTRASWNRVRGPKMGPFLEKKISTFFMERAQAWVNGNNTVFSWWLWASWGLPLSGLLWWPQEPYGGLPSNLKSYHTYYPGSPEGPWEPVSGHILRISQ